MNFVNIHCHALYGVDDGAADCDEMHGMIDAMYRDGIRTVCFTSHFNPGMFDIMVDEKRERFNEALEYAGLHYPDMKLCLGAEVRWHSDAVKNLLSGICFSLNGTRRVLLEFAPYDDFVTVRQGVTKLLTSGFVPVVAHVERYECCKLSNIKELRELGAYIQVNAASVTGKYGFLMKHRVFSIIKAGLADIVADDSHDIDGKAPGLSEAYSVIRRKFGQEVAEDMFVNYPMRVLS